MHRYVLAAVLLLTGCRAVPTAPAGHSSMHMLIATAVAPEPGTEPKGGTIRGIEPLSRPLGAPPAPATLSVTRNSSGDVVLEAQVVDRGVFGEPGGWFAAAPTVYVPGGARTYRVSDGERGDHAPAGRVTYWISGVDSDVHLDGLLTEFPTATSVRVTVPGSWIPPGSVLYWGARQIDANGIDTGALYERAFRL